MVKIKEFFQRVVSLIKTCWQKIRTYLHTTKEGRQKQINVVQKSWQMILRIARLIAIAVLGAVLVHNINLDISTMKEQSFVHDNYKRTSLSYLYIDSNQNEEEQTTKVKAVVDKLPKPLLDIVEDDWLILISNKCPFPSFTTDAEIKGTTYYASKIIWMTSDFTQHELAHEFGHALSFLCGDIHNSSKFLNIYHNGWGKYALANDEPTQPHCISTSSEWFAEMYAEYIMEPDYFRENLPDAYEYMQNLRTHNWRLTSVGKYLSTIDRMFRIVGFKFKSWADDQSFYFTNFSNECKVLFHKKIKSSDLSDSNQMSFKHNETQECLSLVQDVVQHPDKYDDIVFYPIDVSSGDIYKMSEVETVLQAYFLNANETIVGYNAEVVDGNVQFGYTFDKEQLLQLNIARLEMLDNVDSVLMKEIKLGTEREMLIQIMSYILSSANKDLLPSQLDANLFWKEHGQNDTVVAMVFMQFAHRLGIHCDIVISPLDNGQDHVFNRVVLSDGTVVYYDLLNYTAHKENLYHDNIIIYSINDDYR